MSPHLSKQSLGEVVILGHSGFLGSHLISDLPNYLSHSSVRGISSKELDLTDLDAGDRLGALLNDQTTLIVCSGKLKRPYDGFAICSPNLTIGLSVAKAITISPPKRVIYLSTGSVFNETLSGVVTETTETVPSSWYGITKLSVEKLISHAAFESKQCLSTIVRPSIVYGVRDNNLYTPTGFLFRISKNEEISIWGDGTEKRDFVYIKDFVEVMARLIQSPSPPPILHVCGKQELSYLECAQSAAKALQREPNLVFKARNRPFVHQILRSNGPLPNLFEGYAPRTLEEGLVDVLAQLNDVIQK